MRKLLSLSLLLSAFICADTSDSNKAKDISPDTTRVVRCTVTLYRDADSYDHEAWSSLCDCAKKCAQEEASPEGTADDLYRMTKELMTAKKGEKKGIHGDFTLTTSDGTKKSCCGDQCNCAERYRGVCPCTPGDSCNS